jgi:hypothetical protein
VYKTSINTNLLIAFCIVFVMGVPLTGCLNTEGNIEIKGNVSDEFTNAPIPYKSVIVKGLVRRNEKFEPLDAGQFSTDSSGNFTYLLRKVKDAYYYNFYFVGDSDYPFKSTEVALLEIEKNAKYLSFLLSKLADFTINIYRKSQMPGRDTLNLTWESDGIDGRLLYPYKIDDYGEKAIYGLPSDIELRWVGSNIRTTIKTRAFAEKMTKISWELIRNGKIMGFKDTITCKRDFVNNVYFSY